MGLPEKSDIEFVRMMYENYAKALERENDALRKKLEKTEEELDNLKKMQDAQSNYMVDKIVDRKYKFAGGTFPPVLGIPNTAAQNVINPPTSAINSPIPDPNNPFYSHSLGRILSEAKKEMMQWIEDERESREISY